MTLRKLREAWDHFFFTPQSPVPIALFRIFWGICVSAKILLLHADWLNWYGVHGWVTLQTMQVVEPGSGSTCLRSCRKMIAGSQHFSGSFSVVCCCLRLVCGPG